MAVNRNLLCIDDEENIINSLKRFLRKEEYTLFTAGSAEEGMELLDRNEIGVVLSDLMMPGMDGLTFFDVISKTHKDTVKILLTGHASIESTLEAINRLSLFGYLIKPWPASELKSTLKRAFDHCNSSFRNETVVGNKV